ncbi:MAG: LPS export ABC transporter periplasmic protein LptC [Burkholderiaceae bacterium]|nr:MAG: LPS export ABC transporter periplasmic protein LptC [Burkholderiaceae bacterium]TAL99702.1 MAG: LPS export ABC transporter periplasmic protein LptC [Pusillimonas sp.]
MKERVPGLVAIFLLTVLVASTWWAAGYTQRAVQVEPPARTTHEPDAWAQNFVMVRTDPAGDAVNRLEGEYMVHFPDDDSYKVTKAKAVGQRAGSPITVGTSDTAVMDKNGNRIVMTGHAHLHRLPDKDRPALDVTSQQLTLLPNDDVAFTDLPALIVNGHSTMRGKGMRYDNKTRTLKVFSASDVKISGQDSVTRPATKKTETKP